MTNMTRLRSRALLLVVLAFTPVAGAQTVVLEEGFSTWPPAGWSVGGGPCSGWAAPDLALQANYTGGSDSCALADSSACQSGMDAAMLSPVFALPAGSSRAELSFVHDFYQGDFGGSHCDVDISTNGGATFSLLAQYTAGSVRGPRSEQLDLTRYIGSSSLVLRFRFVAPGAHWWWQVDDVKVAAFSCPGAIAPIVHGGPTGCDSPGVVLSTDAYSEYQWQKDGADLPGATAPIFTATESGSYGVRVTDTQGCSGASAPVAVTVYPASPSPSIGLGGPACSATAIQLNATGGGPFVSYQWARGGVPISGETGPTTMASESGWYTVDGVNAQGCRATSSGVAVAVESPAPVIVAPATACGPVALSTGSFASYQWKLRSQPIPGATAQMLVAFSSGSYTVTVTTVGGCTATSPSRVVTIESAPTFTRQPQGLTVASGSSVTLTAAALGTIPMRYQWFVGQTGDASRPLPGAGGTSFTTPPLKETTSYWVRATSGVCPTNSATATVTVQSPCKPPVVTTQPQSQTVGAGQSATLTVIAQDPNGATSRKPGTTLLSYQWYLGAPSETAVPDPIPGATGATYTTPPLSSTTSYWVRVTGSCASVSSSVATVTVHTK
jgi:hypothetical protein